MLLLYTSTSLSDNVARMQLIHDHHINLQLAKLRFWSCYKNWRTNELRGTQCGL